MIAILKREFKSYFSNVIGWLFVAAILFFFGIYFYAYNLRNGYAYISYSLSAIAFLLIISIPVLTMRTMSEEKKTKTDQLTLTSPVSLPGIVIGKFFAAAGVFTIDVLILAVAPLVLALYGTVPMGESYTALLGFWLFGVTCIAIGVLISSLTESQVIAAVLSILVLFVGYLMAGICSLMSEGGNLLTKVLGCYDLYSKIGPFMAGTLDITAVVYFVSLSALALFLTVQVVQKRRWNISVNKIGTGVFSIVSIITAIVLTWGVNFGVSKIPTAYTSIDVTFNKMFALTNATKDYIKTLDEDVTLYVLCAEGSSDTTVRETLGRYDDLSDHIDVKYISASDNPTFYSNYTDTEPSVNSIIVVSDYRSKVIDYNDIYVYSYDYNTYSQSIDAYDAEGQITSAIEYVTMGSENLSTVYMLAGHEEGSIGDKFVSILSKSNTNIEELTLITEDAVPEDAQMVIVYAPAYDFSSDDKDKLEAYIANGGVVVLATSPDPGELPNLEAFLKDYGITKQPGLVMDNSLDHMYGNTPYFILPDVEICEYTYSVSNGYVFTPYASGLTIDESGDSFEYTTILRTSDDAVSKTDTATATTSEFEDGDIMGPFYVGVASSKVDETGKLIVFGTIDIFTNEADEIVAGSNANVFSDVVANHVSDATGDMPVVPAKSYTVDNLIITSALAILYWVVVMVIIPLALIVAGIAIWAARRKR